MRARLHPLSFWTFLRWTGSIAVGFSTMALMLFVFIYWQTAVREEARIDDVITSETQVLRKRPVAEIGGQLEAWLRSDIHEELYGGLFDAHGNREAGNLTTIPRELARDDIPHRAVFAPIERDREGDATEVVRGVATRLPDGRLLVIGIDMDELEEVDDIIVRALTRSLAPMTLLSLVGGTLLTLRAQRRLGDVHRTMDRIMGGALRERLPIRGSSDELDKVSRAVNRMLDKIEYLIDQLRGVGDGIAHDLRTPLTRLRTRLERSRDEALTPAEFEAAMDRAIASVDATLSVVSAVLRIGEIEHGLRRAAFTPVDLAGLLADVDELYEPIAEERNLHIRVQADAGLIVLGDRDLLIETVGNLVDNAVKFAPEESEICLSLHRSGNAALLRVIDHGPGIPLEERERVFQRFCRLEKSRTVEGSGLGLSLVAAIATLHGFDVTIRDATPGCMVEITCPELLHVNSPTNNATTEMDFNHADSRSAL